MPGAFQPGTKTCCQSSGQGRRRCNADLLAEDGPQAELEDTPGSRDAQSGMPFHDRAQELILSEMIGDLIRVGVQIEKLAHVLDEWKKRRSKRCRKAKAKRVLPR